MLFCSNVPWKYFSIEMWIWYVFTESISSKLNMTFCVQQRAVYHVFVLLGLYCNGCDSSCQVSLFSHGREPCSMRCVNPAAFYCSVFLFILLSTARRLSHPALFLQRIIRLIKNGSFNWIQHPPKHVISCHVSVGRVARFRNSPVDW